VAEVVWDWKSKHKGVVTDRRGEPTTIVWGRDIGPFFGYPGAEARDARVQRWLRKLMSDGLLIVKPGHFQAAVKLADGRIVKAYVFRCAPEDVPKPVVEAAPEGDTGRTAGRLLKVGSW
jgi:hypothetical protein